MRQLFNPESLVWKPLGYLGDLVMLSLLWTVFSIPVVTLGPASAAPGEGVHLNAQAHTAIAEAFEKKLREIFG